MAHKLTIGVGWEGRPDFKGLIERSKLMDETGIHSIWLAEAWGHDAFTLLTLVAEHTKRIQIGTFIVNIYGRTRGPWRCARAAGRAGGGRRNSASRRDRGARSGGVYEDRRGTGKVKWPLP